MYLKPVSEIKAKLGIQPNGPVQAFFTDTCKKKMDKYIPYSGDGASDYHLREATEVGVDYITYQTIYAHAQYVGIVHGSPVQNYTTPRNRTILGQSYVECRGQRCNKGSARICQRK